MNSRHGFTAIEFLIVLAILGVLIGLLLPIACSSSVKSGTIIEKLHTDAYTTTDIEYDPILEMPKVTTNHHPESWGFRLKSGDQEGYVSVSRPIWEHFKEGEFFSF